MMSEDLLHKNRQPFTALFYLLFKYGRALFNVFGILIGMEIFRFITKDDYKFARVFFTILVFIGVSLFLALKEYFFLYYYIDKNQLIVHNGVIKKTKTVIPISSIQNITTKANWIQKILGVTTITVDTAGGEKEEAEFIMLHKNLETFKQLLLKKEDNHATQNLSDIDKPVFNQQQFPIIFETHTKDVLKLGLSANHLETFTIVAVFLFSQLQELKKYFKENIEQATNSASSYFEQTLHTLWGILFFIFALLVFTIIISVFRSFLKYFDYKIRRTDNGFFIEYGLLSTIEKIIPLKKIQWVSWSANALRIKLKLFEFKFLVSGEEHLKNKLKAHVPITRTALLNTLANEYCSLSDFNFEHKHIIQTQYITVQYLLKILPLLIFIISAGIFIDLELLALLIVPVYLGIKIILKTKRSYLVYNTDGIYIHYQSFGQNIIVVRWDKMQSITLSQSGYQKRNQLASIKIHTSAGEIRFPYLKLNEVFSIYNLALYKMETTKWD